MLNEYDKQEIIDLIRKGKQLPARFRDALFPRREGQYRPRCSREASAFRVVERFGYPDDQGWANKLIMGENSEILFSLLDGSARETIERLGGLKLVYIDPPFNVGRDFYMDLPLGAGTEALKAKAYADRWGENFYETLRERLELVRELMADDGCVFVHCDWRANARIRLSLDEIFKFYENEIVWRYTGGGRSSKRFSRKHDTIYLYSKSGKLRFFGDAVRVPYKATSGYAKSGITSRAGKRYLPNPAGTIPDDVWEIPMVNPLSRERTGYPTQKPEALIERILLACSREGDLVADFFCGSGVLPATAQRLGRKWIAVDSGSLAISITKKRLLSFAAPTAFDVLELAPREDEKDDRIARIAGAWGADRIDDDLFVGMKSSRPVTISLQPASRALLASVIDRCRRDGLLAADILAASFAPDALPWTLEEARRHGVDLRLRRVRQGEPSVDASFIPAAYPAVEPIFEDNMIAAKLAGYRFCLADGETLESVAGENARASRWQDWIDYWSTDFEYESDGIIKAQWSSFRDRKNRRLEFASEFRPIYSTRQKIAARVVDIFGSEASVAMDIHI